MVQEMDEGVIKECVARQYGYREASVMCHGVRIYQRQSNIYITVVIFIQDPVDLLTWNEWFERIVFQRLFRDGFCY